MTGKAFHMPKNAFDNLPCNSVQGGIVPVPPGFEGDTLVIDFDRSDSGETMLNLDEKWMKSLRQRLNGTSAVSLAELKLSLLEKLGG